MKSNRTEGWWLTRFELAVAVLVIFLLVLVILSDSRPLDDISLVVGPLVATPGSFALVALAVAVVGLVWMLRIFRGPRDEPPQWRYRDP